MKHTVSLNKMIDFLWMVLETFGITLKWTTCCIFQRSSHILTFQLKSVSVELKCFSIISVFVASLTPFISNLMAVILNVGLIEKLNFPCRVISVTLPDQVNDHFQWDDITPAGDHRPPAAGLLSQWGWKHRPLIVARPLSFLPRLFLPTVLCVSREKANKQTTQYLPVYLCFASLNAGFYFSPVACILMPRISRRVHCVPV